MILTDEKIESLVHEKKKLPHDIFEIVRDITRYKSKRGHKELSFELEGRSKNKFKLILRLSNYNYLDFSWILIYLRPCTNSEFILRRYNGKSHEHVNPKEKEVFYDFHVHYATQRYQEEGFKAEIYAEPSDRYSQHIDALHCLIEDCNCYLPGISTLGRI